MKKVILTALIIALLTIAMNGKTSAVPEPTTMLLFGIGLIGLAGFTKKKSHKK